MHGGNGPHRLMHYDRCSPLGPCNSHLSFCHGTFTDRSIFSGAPYLYTKEKETHELTFSWLSWLAALLVGACARRRWRRRSCLTWRPYSKHETYSLGSHCTSLILDIHTMINWHLSKQDIRWPVLSRDHIAGSSLQLIEVTCFCEVDRWPSAGFPIESRVQVRLTCWKPRRIVLKPNYNFFFYTNVFAPLFCEYVDYIKTQNRRRKKILTTKLQKSNQILPPGPGATLLGYPKSLY